MSRTPGPHDDSPGHLIEDHGGSPGGPDFAPQPRVDVSTFDVDAFISWVPGELKRRSQFVGHSGDRR